MSDVSPGLPSDNLIIEGLRTLEVRWILPGPLHAAVAGWFGRFPALTDAREDSYLIDRELRGLSSVKVRAGRAVEVKVYHGEAGMLELPGRACGRLQSWQKWSIPVGPLTPDGAGRPGWAVIGKRRRISRFGLSGGRVAAGVPEAAGQPVCAVELTEIQARGEDWWSLGFEATGPADALRTVLEGAAGLVFACPLPGGTELQPGDCRSYAEWLSRVTCPG